jgi:glutamate racemase
LPGESTVYFGDTARVPYGSKSRDVIARFSLEIGQFLMNEKVKMIVVACNTASAFALTALQARLPVPIVGVIEPGAQAALKTTQTRRVGVIGTEGTIHSGIYAQKLKQAAPALKTYSVACPLFVPVIEEGLFSGPIVNQVIELYLKRFKKTNIRAIILGCTHYPFFKRKIRDYFRHKVKVMDSATRTAAAVVKLLDEQGMRAPNRRIAFGDHRFMVTDYPEKFRRTGEMFLGQTLLIEKVTI